MGRGLSDLQKTMLAMAWRNRETEQLGPAGVFVHFSEKDADGNEIRDNAEAWDRLWLAGGVHLLPGEEDNPATLEWWRAKYGDRPYRGHIAFQAVCPEIGPFAVGCPTSETEARKIAARFAEQGIKTQLYMDSVRTPDLYSWEVLAAYYDFAAHPFRDVAGYTNATHHDNARYLDEPCEVGSPMHELIIKRHGCRTPIDTRHFAMSEIGEAKYNAAKVAVSKAFKRLQARGFARWYTWRGCGSGIKLTDTGAVEGERLLANGSYKTITVSQYGQRHEQRN